MIMKDDLTLDGGHRKQYKDHVSELYTLNLYDPIN